MVMVIPGLQRSQFAPQKKQESMPGRPRELYVLIAFLAEIKNMIIHIIYLFKNDTIHSRTHLAHSSRKRVPQRRARGPLCSF